MSSFRVEEVTEISSFDKIIPLFWKSNTDPRNAAMEFVYPVKGTSKEAYEAAIEDSKKRIISSHVEDPSSHWIQVLDSKNDNTVVAAAEWHIFDNNETNPYARESYPPTDIDWWPEGDTKRFTIIVIDTGLAISRKRMRRPFVGLYLCFTDPMYRRHGAGAMLVDWGIKKADEWGLECFLSATPGLGKPLYEKAQFIVVDETILEMRIPDPSEEWKACQRQLLPYSWYNMWRPIGGKHDEGAKYPWED